MIKLESKDLSFSIKSVGDYITKKGVECVKVKGCLNAPVFFNEESKRAMPTRNYFQSVLVFGDKEYLEELKNRVYDPANESVKINIKNAYVSLPFFNGRSLTQLYIIDSDFDKDKVNAYAPLHKPSDYLLPTPKSDK